MPEEVEGKPERVFIQTQKENFNSTEYERALKSLQIFAESNINKINSLNDLNWRLHDRDRDLDIGRELEIVSIVNGKHQEGFYAYDSSQQANLFKSRYAMSKPVEAGEIFLAVDINYKNIYLTQLTEGEGLAPLRANFVVYLPINSKITKEHTNPEDPFETDDSVKGYAEERPDGNFLHGVLYDPDKEPYNPEMQRGYARLLQKGIKDILSAAKLPTKLPSELDFALFLCFFFYSYMSNGGLIRS